MNRYPTREAIISALRSLVFAPVGTWIVANGYAAGQTADVITGALVVLATALWGVADKFLTEWRAEKREVIAVQAGVLAGRNGADTAPTISNTKEIIATYAPIAEKESKP